MKQTTLSLRFALLAASALILMACKDTSTSTHKEVELETDDQRLSYILGQNIARQTENSDVELDMNAVHMGVNDVFSDKTDRLSKEDIQTAIANVQKRAREKANIEAKAVLEKNKAEGAAYLLENAKKDGVVATESGLQYKEITAGTGAKPGPDDRVTVHYEGTLIDGTVFDSSYKSGEPVTFAVGGVIAGWTEALQLMNVGDVFELTIPENIAYGESGSRSIKPGTTLLFKVELVGIEE